MLWIDIRGNVWESIRLSCGSRFMRLISGAGYGDYERVNATQMKQRGLVRVP